MVYVFSHQTNDEQEVKYTRHKNARGFTAVDGEICSSIVIQIIKKQTITEKQKLLLFQKSEKYHKQEPPEDFDAFTYAMDWRAAHQEEEAPAQVVDTNECLISDD
jgi:hypothetical protein